MHSQISSLHSRAEATIRTSQFLSIVSAQHSIFDYRFKFARHTTNWKASEGRVCYERRWKGQLESRLEYTYTATVVGFLCKCGKMRLSPRLSYLRPRLHCDLISHFVSAHYQHHSAI